MNRPQAPRIAHLLCVAMLTGLVLCANFAVSFARAGLNVESVAASQPPNPVPEAEDDIEDLDDANLDGGMRRIVMSSDEFEQWIYGNLGGSKLAFEQMYRNKVKTALNQVDQICVLRPEQWDKLNAAIDIEIQRFEAKIASLTSEFASHKTADKQQQCFNRASEITNACNADISMIWTKKDQFWRKVLFGQLNEGQRKQLADDQSLRQSLRNENNLTLIILQLQRKLGLTAQQRAKIIELLRSEKEPRTYDAAWLMLMELPNDTKVLLFSEKQRSVLNVHVNNDGDGD